MSFRFHLIMVIKFYLVLTFLLKSHGGDEEIRTPDPLLARQVLSQLSYTPIKQSPKWKELMFSLERRWSSRTFRYGYLVTTSPQSLTLPSTTPSLRLGHRLRVLPTSMVWRAVCTRPGNAFTAALWSTITSNSNFMHSSCRVQSELRQAFWVLLNFAVSLPCVPAIVARV